jgi:hypothetical protein
MASQRLLFDTAGVTMEGSPSLFLMDTQRELDMDTLILRREGHKEYLQLRGQAKAMRRAASDTKFATFTSVVGEVAKGLAMS